MGLQSDLGLYVKAPNAIQRALQQVGASRPGAWLFQKTLFHFDRPLYRWSGGRASIPGITIGLPAVLLTTTGARSGQPRTMPVCPIAVDDDLVILGTNFGQERTPGWVFNLLANPRASVTWRDRTVSVQAARIPAEEMPGIWDRAATVYSGFPTYRERTDGRRVIHAFRLIPA